jgi:TonB family protein
MYLAIATAAIIAPALIYTVMHPAAVTSTVRQFTKHLPTPVKEIHVAVVATRSTPTPRPVPSPTAVATKNPAQKSATANAAQLAHLKRVHALAFAASTSHAKKLASIGQTSDISASGATQNASSSQSSGTVGAPASADAANTPAAVAAAPVGQQPVADATPVYAPDIVVDARFTREVQPDYPEVARMQNAQGTAVVLATIGPTGNVLSERIDKSTGNSQLDAAALAAARMSSFEPPKINGKPATETYRLVYTFTQ